MTTEHTRVRKASRILIHFGLANSPGDVSLKVSKSEIHRLIRDEGLVFDDDEICNVEEGRDGTLHIFFST